MSFDTFKAMISTLARAYGLGQPKFRHNLDKGRYEARLRGGVFITGSMSKPSLTWNEPNHRHQIPISQLNWAV